jgi:hypothetical protein
MTERTINQARLKAILDSTFDITETIFTDITEAAFPPLFTPKEGEIIWVRRSEHHQWELIGFHSMDNGQYCCTWSNGEKGLSYPIAKPQTPTQKGEG